MEYTEFKPAIFLKHELRALEEMHFIASRDLIPAGMEELLADTNLVYVTPDGEVNLARLEARIAFVRELLAQPTSSPEVMEWDWKDSAPITELSKAAQSGLVHFTLVDNDTDAYVCVCSAKPLSQGEAQRVYYDDLDDDLAC